VRLATLETPHGNKVAGAVSDAATALQFVDLTAADPLLPNCMKAILALPDGLARAGAAQDKGARAGLFLEGAPIAPIPSPGKVICIGLNYRDHAAESGVPIPTAPVCFSKFSQAVVGPGAVIRLPKVAHQVDYEAELVVVIGKKGKHIPEENARRHVAVTRMGMTFPPAIGRLGGPADNGYWERRRTRLLPSGRFWSLRTKCPILTSF